MKSILAFGLGLAGGAMITSALLVALSSHDRKSKDAEIATLRADLSRAQKAAQQDREVLRSALQQRQVLHDASLLKPSPTVPIRAASPISADHSAIAVFLGASVPPPQNLDRKYSPEEISAVFRDLTETLGIKVDTLSVDTTEFPFVLHGRVESPAGADFFKKIEAELRALPGYTYGGSVTGSNREGTTDFVLNIIPSSACPPEQAEAIRRRLMLRMQIVAAASRQSSP